MNIKDFLTKKENAKAFYERFKIFIIPLAAFLVTWFFFGIMFNVSSSRKKSAALSANESAIRLRSMSGVKRYYYTSGKLKIEIPYKNGKINGVRKHYYEDGALQAERSYKNGKEFGIEKYYYEDGSLSLEIPYKDGRYEGVARYYYRDGTLKRKIFFKNNKPRRIDEYPLIE